jgi:UDP-N-acetylmuramoyl-L-alanyl-D-glutamate--2,6-diaminopimelate ligase
MRLSTLVKALPSELAPSGAACGESNEDPVIRGVAYDSRCVVAGDLFFALRGADVDGHDFVAKAFELGAAAAVVESAPPGLDLRDHPFVVVTDSRRALASISTRFFGNPSAELTLIGITGTNGKTSTAYLVESILSRAAWQVGVIGTLEIRYAGERTPAVNTTPESCELQRTLRAMRTHDIDAVVMEVSSHGLALGRVDGCRFAAAALTNVTQDHLDFHETMDLYREAKLQLFDHYLDPNGSAVINVDDPSAEDFVLAAQRTGARIIRVSRQDDREAEVRLEAAQVSLDGTNARLVLPDRVLDVRIPLVGDFNLENTLVACGIGVALGITPEAIAAGVESCPQVPGRMERVAASDPNEPSVIVDYAHTPDAVDKLLATLRPLANGRLIAVFGCGGDRDRGKRPLMAEAVARWSDRVVATSDNPRTEDPQRILEDVTAGLGRLRCVGPDALSGADRSYALLPDRRSAIELAIGIAQAEDMVVIAGKGHEDYQIIGRERLPFVDRDEARRALDARSAR